jgi:steroid delta-isomerase-like uncharacterized protein
MTDSDTRDPRIDLVERLFAAWSTGDVDAPEAFFHAEAVLRDIVGGEYTGWPAIRAFFARGLRLWPDLKLVPAEYWTNDKGVALRWTMSATVTDPALFGEAAVGKTWASDGMTWLVIEDGLIRLEVDYHDSGAVPKSLGLASPR